jgi:hypothetical protein
MSASDERDENALQEISRIRKKAALVIEPETAEVHWEYGVILDPYGEKKLSEESRQIARLYFARAPDSDISVSFHDLPDAVTRSLQQKVTFKEIVKLAQLLEATSVHANVCPSCIEALERGMSRLFQAGMFAMLLAARQLLQGRSYGITTDDPQTIRRCISLAKHMGASVSEIRRDGFLTKLVLVPASAEPSAIGSNG